MLTSSQKQLFIATSVVILVFAGFMTVLIQEYVIDNNPPTLVSIGINKTPKVNTSFTIQVDAVDQSQIVSAEINYRTKQGSWISDEMRKYFILCCPPRFLIRMGPFHEVGIQVDFYFRITDSHNNELITDTYSFEIISA
jgi:hypothetical protein